MMRRRRADRRRILPDPKFKSTLIAKFINVMMKSGKRSTAERIFYEALDITTQKVETPNAVKIVEKALANTRPLLMLKSRRVGGATYQIPVEVTEDKGILIAMRWLREFARSRKGRGMQERLAEELREAFQGTGPSVKKRDEVHRMAEANRAFSHYRW
ncbi:MAG: 30S ribosomal protein S7 [Candidatus Omnitrophica bacterium]|nr:30S ribosomal protein S7 [Candidatus Omnitrophota bacterium]